MLPVVAGLVAQHDQAASLQKQPLLAAGLPVSEIHYAGREQTQGNNSPTEWLVIAV
jgi:hypothetical protein